MTATAVSKIDTGSPSITTVGTVTTGTWHGSLIPLAYGGTNANLTASNGGILYSTASAGAILAGTATANQTILSGASSAPAWTTTTWPATITANNLVAGSSSNNAVTGFSTGNAKQLASTSAGALTGVTLNSAQVLIGNTNNTPTAAQFSTNSNQPVSMVGGVNSITLRYGVLFNQNSSSATVTAFGTYIINNGASLVTITLQNSPTAGQWVRVIGASSGGWKIGQPANFYIVLPGGATTTTGTSGYLQSNNQYDCVTLIYSETTDVWLATNIKGNIIYN